MADRAVSISAAQKGTYAQIIDTLISIFGSHPGYRPAHAKGVLCEGIFTPNPAAASISRASHLQGDPVPIAVRFSDFAGIPTVRDSDANASPRGLGIRFHLPDGADTDIVAHSYNGFPVATAEEFLTFLKALASSGSDAPKPTPLETFLASHPRAKLFVAPRPVPASFAAESYYGVDAFRFINRAGAARLGRYRIHPVGGEHYLDTAAVAASPANFLFEELATRLTLGPARFHLFVQLAEHWDQTNDASISWPDDRLRIELGTLAVTRNVADSDAAQRRLRFDPTRLVDGIELSDDPLLIARSAVYALSYERRQQSSPSGALSAR
jgi:catalase